MPEIIYIILLLILIICVIFNYRNDLVHKWMARRIDEVYDYNMSHRDSLEYPDCYDELLFNLCIWTYKDAFPPLPE